MTPEISITPAPPEEPPKQRKHSGQERFRRVVHTKVASLNAFKKGIKKKPEPPKAEVKPVQLSDYSQLEPGQALKGLTVEGVSVEVVETSSTGVTPPPSPKRVVTFRVPQIAWKNSQSSLRRSEPDLRNAVILSGEPKIPLNPPAAKKPDDDQDDGEEEPPDNDKVIKQEQKKYVLHITYIDPILSIFTCSASAVKERSMPSRILLLLLLLLFRQSSKNLNFLLLFDYLLCTYSV